MKSRTAGKKLGYFNYIIALTFLLMFLSLGCSKEENPVVPVVPPPGGGGGSAIDALIGTWNCTEWIASPGLPNDINPQNTLAFTFTATTLTSTGTGGFDPASGSGPVTVTATTITYMGDTWSYTLSGNTLTIPNIEGAAAKFQKQ